LVRFEGAGQEEDCWYDLNGEYIRPRQEEEEFIFHEEVEDETSSTPAKETPKNETKPKISKTPPEKAGEDVANEVEWLPGDRCRVWEEGEFDEGTVVKVRNKTVLVRKDSSKSEIWHVKNSNTIQALPEQPQASSKQKVAVDKSTPGKSKNAGQRKSKGATPSKDAVKDVQAASSKEIELGVQETFDADSKQNEKAGNNAFSKGDLCEAFAEGEWWLAKIIRCKQGKALVRFEGAGQEEDCWYDLNGEYIRPRQEEGEEIEIESPEVNEVPEEATTGKHKKSKKGKDVSAEIVYMEEEIESKEVGSSSKAKNRRSLRSSLGGGEGEAAPEAEQAKKNERKSSKKGEKETVEEAPEAPEPKTTEAKDAGKRSKRKRNSDILEEAKQDNDVDMTIKATNEINTFVTEYNDELQKLQGIYKKFKDSVGRDDIERLTAEIHSVHLRFHARSIGQSIAGIFRLHGVKCNSCGAKTPGKKPMDAWKQAYTQCSRCGELHAKKRYCSVCDKVLKEIETEDQILKCSVCDLWVHGRCDDLDELSLVGMNLLSSEHYVCPKHRRSPSVACSIGEYRCITMHTDYSGNILQATRVFGVRTIAGGSIALGLQVEGGLVWYPQRASAESKEAKLMKDLLFRFFSTDQNLNLVIHPDMPDAKAKAKRWGEIVRVSGGADAPLKIGQVAMHEPCPTYVEAITGVRKLPSDLFPASGGSFMSDIYVEVKRGGLQVWTRLPPRNTTMHALLASFLLTSVGIISIFLPINVRETFLKQANLWDSYMEGLGDTAGKDTSSNLTARAINSDGSALSSSKFDVTELKDDDSVPNVGVVGCTIMQDGAPGVVVDQRGDTCAVVMQDGETVELSTEVVMELII